MGSIARLVALLDANGFEVLAVQAEGGMFDHRRNGIGLSVSDRWASEAKQGNGKTDEGAQGND